MVFYCSLINEELYLNCNIDKIKFLKRIKMNSPKSEIFLKVIFMKEFGIVLLH